MPSTERQAPSSFAPHAALACGLVFLSGAYGFLTIFWFVFWRMRIVSRTLQYNPGVFLDFASLVQSGIGAVFCLLGAYVATKARDRAGVRVLAMYLIAQGLATGYLNSLIDNFGFGDWHPRVALLLVNGLAYAAALRATQLFPGPLTSAEIASLIERSRFTRSFWYPVSWLLKPVRVWALVASLILLVQLTANELLFSIGQLIVLFLAVSTLMANYLTGTEGERSKIYWLLTGALILLLGRVSILAGTLLISWLDIPDFTLLATSVVVPAVGVLRLFAWTVSVSLMIVCILLAIFYRGAISPEMVIRRTAIASAGIGLLFFTFGVFVNYVSAVVVETLDLEETLVEAVAATLIALSFRPLDKWLTRLTDRFIPGPPLPAQGAATIAASSLASPDNGQ